MFNCMVKMYGLPYGLTDQHEVEIELNEGATLRNVIVALKNKLPLLEGPVFRKDIDTVVEHYRFNVNGQFYYDNVEDVTLKNGDEITLLTVITGG